MRAHLGWSSSRAGSERITPRGESWARLVGHAVVGWMICAVTMGGLLAVAPPWVALHVHAVVAPLVFVVLSLHYFRAAGARAPLSTAIAFVCIVALLDLLVVAALVLHDFSMFRSVAGTWLPFALIFLATWLTGEARAIRLG